MKLVPLVSASAIVGYLWIDHGWLAMFAGIIMYLFGHFAGSDEN